MKILKQGCGVDPINGKSHVALNMKLEDHHCEDNLEDDDVLGNGEEKEHFNFPLAYELCVGHATLHQLK